LRELRDQRALLLTAVRPEHLAADLDGHREARCAERTNGHAGQVVAEMTACAYVRSVLGASDAELHRRSVAAAELVAGPHRHLAALLRRENRGLQHSLYVPVLGRAGRVPLVVRDDDARITRHDAEEACLAAQDAPSGVTLPQPDRPATEHAGDKADHHVQDNARHAAPSPGRYFVMPGDGPGRQITAFWSDTQ
jgi:hypothetical protein